MILLLFLAMLTLAEHSPDHAHVVLGGPCFGEEHVISLPTPESASALFATLDKDRWAMGALGFNGGVEVLPQGTQPKSSLPQWCGP